MIVLPKLLFYSLDIEKINNKYNVNYLPRSNFYYRTFETSLL